MISYNHKQIGYDTIISSIFGVVVGILALTYYYLFTPLGVSWDWTSWIFVLFLVLCLLTLVFSSSQLIVIDDGTLRIKNGRFVKIVSLDNIQSCKVVEVLNTPGWRYPPAILVRSYWDPWGRYYWVSGRRGVNIELGSGEKIIIGTDEPSKLKRAIDKVKH